MDNHYSCCGSIYGHGIDRETRSTGSQAPPAEVELPMMFTKRATSIIPSGGKIYLHPAATQSVDYEGELAIIIGKAGRFQLPVANRCFYLFDGICRLLDQEGRCAQIRLGGYDFERRMLHWLPNFILYNRLIIHPL